MWCSRPDIYAFEQASPNNHHSDNHPMPHYASASVVNHVAGCGLFIQGEQLSRGACPGKRANVWGCDCPHFDICTLFFSALYVMKLYTGISTLLPSFSRRNVFRIDSMSKASGLSKLNSLTVERCSSDRSCHSMHNDVGSVQ